MSSIATWAKRIGLGLLTLIAVALVAGAIYEHLTVSRVTKEFPARGRLVDVGGRSMHIDCRGTGSPTILFEAGLDSYGSLSWSAVQDKLSQGTRTCSYDRAGIMWSDPSPQKPTARAVADDLHTLLKAAGEKGPYVVVGHSFAGPWLTNYTKFYGSDVAGLVFVDTSHPDQQKVMKRLWGYELEAPFIMRALVAAQPFGISRLLLGPDVAARAAAPPEANRAMHAFLPFDMKKTVEEVDQINATLAEAGTARSFGDRPLIVLTGPKKDAGRNDMEQGLTQAQIDSFDKAWTAMQEDQSHWSTRGRHRTIPDASHYVQFDRPDVVIAAVNEVVGEVRNRQRSAISGMAQTVSRKQAAPRAP